MILLKCVYNIRKNVDGAKITIVKKITMTQQRSTEQRSAVDPKNLKMPVSQSVNVSSLETVCLTTIESSAAGVLRNLSTVC